MRPCALNPNLYLITPYQLSLVPDGTELTSYISIKKVVKGIDFIHNEYGNENTSEFLSVGFVDPLNTLDKDLLTMLMLATGNKISGV